MSTNPNSVAELFELARSKTPAYLDLATAETDEESEAAFTAILERAVQHLEQNKKTSRSWARKVYQELWQEPYRFQGY